MVDATIINDTLDILVAKAEAIDTYLTTAKGKTLTGKSSQTWHGIPEEVTENLNQAIDMLNNAFNKIKSAV